MTVALFMIGLSDIDKTGMFLLGLFLGWYGAWILIWIAEETNESRRD